MTNLERAIKDGYAHIIGEKGKEKITYVSSDNHVENYSDPEEKVRAEFWAELIYKYEYPVNRIKIEVTVPDRLPSDRADIVVEAIRQESEGRTGTAEPDAGRDYQDRRDRLFSIRKE